MENKTEQNDEIPQESLRKFFKPTPKYQYYLFFGGLGILTGWNLWKYFFAHTLSSKMFVVYQVIILFIGILIAQLLKEYGVFK